jgi:hypothetical protein
MWNAGVAPLLEDVALVDVGVVAEAGVALALTEPLGESTGLVAPWCRTITPSPTAAPTATTEAALTRRTNFFFLGRYIGPSWVERATTPVCGREVRLHQDRAKPSVIKKWRFNRVDGVARKFSVRLSRYVEPLATWRKWTTTRED